MPKKISYSSAGVNIDNADQTKKRMAKDLESDSPLVLNKVGAFASLCDGSFPGYKHPVLVCKTEEPGSKQLLAFTYNRTKGICYDLINHLVNDVIVMGAAPLFVQDLIVCGKLEKDVVSGLVRDIAEACKAQGCVLTGGETSEQPAVIEAGRYVLGASCIGVVEKDAIIDGAKIRAGDTILALESSGLHTNGYTLIRALIKEDPMILDRKIDGKTFLDLIMEPHRCYYHAVKDLFSSSTLHGLAHITGGGIAGNLNRILPKGMNAEIDLSLLRVPKLFSFIRQESGNDDADMMKTFNLGCGMNAIIAPEAESTIIEHLASHGILAYPIGTIVSGGSALVKTHGSISW